MLIVSGTASGRVCQASCPGGTRTRLAMAGATLPLHRLHDELLHTRIDVEAPCPAWASSPCRSTIAVQNLLVLRIAAGESLHERAPARRERLRRRTRSDPRRARRPPSRRRRARSTVSSPAPAARDSRAPCAPRPSPAPPGLWVHCFDHSVSFCISISFTIVLNRSQSGSRRDWTDRSASLIAWMAMSSCRRFSTSTCCWRRSVSASGDSRFSSRPICLSGSPRNFSTTICSRRAKSLSRTEPVPAVGATARLQQPETVVVVQRADGDARELRELLNAVDGGRTRLHHGLDENDRA